MSQVLVFGSDARTHAIVWKLAQSWYLRRGKIYALPGNAGTAQIPVVENHPELLTRRSDGSIDYAPMGLFARQHGVDLVVFCEEAPLLAGAADRCRDMGLTVFGPRMSLAQALEGRKKLAKELMRKGGIPTADSAVFDVHDKALEYLRSASYPLFIKADESVADRSLSAVECKTVFDAKRAIDHLFGNCDGPRLTSRILVEEFLEGPEASFHALVDQTGYVDHWPVSQDHKRLYADGFAPHVRNPNTGGMGAVAPVPWVREPEIEQSRRRIVEAPVLLMAEEKVVFEGCLYPGVKFTPAGPKCLEYNVRFGNPECQAYMRLFAGDLFETLFYAAIGRLREYPSRWSGEYAACVMVASGGYGTGEIITGLPVRGLDDAEAIKSVVVFHGGTRSAGGMIMTGDAGRPFAVTATGSTLRMAIHRANQASERINFPHRYFRGDIGQEALRLAGL